MSLHHHITLAEHQEKSISWTREAAEKYTESAGYRETSKFTAAWEELKAYAAAQTGGSRNAWRITADLQRLGGDMGELRLTKEQFRQPTIDEGGGEEGGEEGGESGGADNTQDAPSYTSQSNVVATNILAHPNFANLGGLERRALKAMMDGHDEQSFIDDASAPSGVRRIIDCIGSTGAGSAYDYISRGVFQFLDVSTEVTARWKGGSNSYTAGTIASPPGGFRAGAGRNFLCTGSGQERQGNERWNSASFRMSGAGGWDKNLYK